MATPALVKHVPNALSALRIPLSLSLLSIAPFSLLFNLVYVLCGVTDALDGWVARKYNAQSQLGAKLDSAADITFFAVALYSFFKALQIPLILTIWALGIVLVRGVGLWAAFVKYRSWAALHTTAFKVCGFVFFVFPLLAAWLGVFLAGALLCALATFATGEELYINRNSLELDLDTRGVFSYRYQLPGGGEK